MSVVDVREPSDIISLKKEIKRFEEMLLLIYSDTCGHCHRYKSLWDKLHKLDRKRGLASINSSQLANTDYADLKIRGYPSVIKVVNGRAVETMDDTTGETTNAMNSEYRDEDHMTKLVNGDAPFLNEKDVAPEAAEDAEAELSSDEEGASKSVAVPDDKLAPLDTQEPNSGRPNNTIPSNTGSKPVVINTNKNEPLTTTDTDETAGNVPLEPAANKAATKTKSMSKSGAKSGAKSGVKSAVQKAGGRRKRLTRKKAAKRGKGRKTRK
jgi:hypothetical protein